MNTWTWRDSKRKAKQGLICLDEAQDDVFFWLSWKAWRFRTTLGRQRHQNLLVVVLIETARTFMLQSFRRSAKELRRSLGQDKAHYLEKVIVEADKKRGADIFQALKPLRIGSQIRKRGIRTLPFLIDGAGQVAHDELARDKLWSDHCAAMEAGVETSEKRLVQRMRRRTVALFDEIAGAHVQLQQVPTLVELEGCFRRIKPRKAAGADGFRSDICSLASADLARKFHPILTKIFIKGEEPIQLKGGLVVSAFKGGKHTAVENYRSLLLGSHLGKALR